MFAWMSFNDYNIRGVSTTAIKWAKMSSGHRISCMFLFIYSDLRGTNAVEKEKRNFAESERGEGLGSSIVLVFGA
jgi:hypothetical protein